MTSMKFFFISFYFFIFLSCNNTENKKKSERLSNESKVLLEDNKLEEAQTIIQKSIELDPENYVAFNNRAYLKIKQNKSSEEILSDFRKALNLKPNYEISLYSLANYFHEIKDYKSAIENANIYLEYARRNKFDNKLIQHIYGLRGDAKYMSGKFDEAIPDLKTALKLDSTDAAAHKDLGDCYFNNNLVETAIKEYTIAIALDSNYYQAYLARARSYESSKLPSLMILAERDYIRAFKINPFANDIYETNSPLFKKTKQSIKSGN